MQVFYIAMLALYYNGSCWNHWGQNLFEEEPSPENLVGVWICPHVRTLDFFFLNSNLNRWFFTTCFTTCFDVVEKITWGCSSRRILLAWCESGTPGLTTGLQSSAVSIFWKQNMGRINGYPPKTYMTGWKIHHEWRCISYWTWWILQCHVSFRRCTLSWKLTLGHSQDAWKKMNSSFIFFLISLGDGIYIPAVYPLQSPHVPPIELIAL